MMKVVEKWVFSQSGMNVREEGKDREREEKKKEMSWVSVSQVSFLVFFFFPVSLRFAHMYVGIPVDTAKRVCFPSFFFFFVS